MTQTPELHVDKVTLPEPSPAQVGLGSPRRQRRLRPRSGSLRLLLLDRYRCFIGLIVAGLAAALLAELPNSILQDTWLALVDGRLLIDHGIPHSVVLTVLGHGHGWVDQQWLAQALMYGCYQVGGLGLVGVLDVALITLGLLGAIWASIRLGAGARSVLLVCPVVAIVAAFTNEVRTQPFAYPLFVLIVYLLARDSRRPSPAVYWCLPVLVLWGNLHGSASLGAGLVLLRGLTLLWARGAAARRRALALIVGPPVALLLTPYGIAMISYYRATLLSPPFRSFVTEWQPVTAIMPLAALFFILAGVAVWTLGRYGSSSTLWERLATLVMAAGAIVAVRNVVWFALAMLVLLPVWLDAAPRARERPAPARPRLNGTLLGAAGAVVAALAISSVAAPAARLTPHYPAPTLRAVRAALSTHPGARVFADDAYADWLLWELPGLRGRVAYDVAFEILSPAQLAAIADFKSVSGLEWLRGVRGYRVLVLGDGGNPDPVRALRTQTGARLLDDHDGVAVLAR